MRATVTPARVIAALLTFSSMAFFSACGGGSKSNSQGGGGNPISVSITQGTTANVSDGQTLALNATVVNDSANAGVTWSVTGTGTLTGSSTSSTTYNAPATGTGTDTVTATSVTDTSKKASISISYSPAAAISVSITQGATANVTDGLTLPLTATVMNDSANAGVTWSVVGTGTLTGSTTTATTYNAPATGTGTDMVTATSVTDTSKKATIAITYAPPPAIIVTIASKFSQVVVNGAAVNLTAGVQNDSANAGVTWTLTAGGTDCQPGCGTLSGATATQVTYTPPSSVPTPATAVITATSVTDTTKTDTNPFTILSVAQNACSGAPTGHESLLNGHYAFLLRGFSGSGAGTPFFYAGGITVNGAGKITAGEFDTNDTATPAHLTVDTTNSIYTLGLDATSSGNLGCLALTGTGGATVTFHFVAGTPNIAGVDQKGRIIEFDDSTGTGTRVAGQMLLQTTSAFALSHLQSHYAFGVDGWDFNASAWEHFAMGGNFSASTTGALTNGTVDVDDGGSVFSDVTGATGTINAISATTGRATGSITVPGDATPFGFAIYVVSNSEFFILGTDAVTTGPVIAGRGIVTGASFSGTSLSGNYIVSVAGSSGGAASVTLGVLNLTSGAVNGTLNEFDSGSGTITPQPISGGTYAVGASSGRVTLSGVGSNPPAVYLTIPTDGVAAFIIGTDGSAVFGTVDPQGGGTYSLSSIAGKSYYGTQEMADNSVQNNIGVVTVDGTTGVITGTEQSSAGVTPFLNLSGSVSGTLTVNSDGTGNVGAGTYFVTNGTDYFILNGSDAEILVGSK